MLSQRARDRVRTLLLRHAVRVGNHGIVRVVAEVDADGVVTSLGPGDTHIVAFYDNGVSAVPVLRQAISSLRPPTPSAE